MTGDPDINCLNTEPPPHTQTRLGPWLTENRSEPPTDSTDKCLPKAAAASRTRASHGSNPTSASLSFVCWKEQVFKFAETATE